MPLANIGQMSELFTTEGNGEGNGYIWSPPSEYRDKRLPCFFNPSRVMMQFPSLGEGGLHIRLLPALEEERLYGN
jgi:hypothetical protein